MLKNIVLLYFLIATVTGHIQPLALNYGQDQLQSPVEQMHASKDVATEFTRRLNQKPCPRRKNQNANSASEWLPTYHSKITHNTIDQKIAREASQPHLTPQSLKENTFRVQEDNKITYIKPFESDEDQDIMIKNPVEMVREDITPESYKLGNHNSEDPIEEYLCPPEPLENYSRRSNPGIDDVQKQALRLLTKCVQDSSTKTADEASSRRSFSDFGPEISSSSSFSVPVHDDSNELSRHDALDRNNDFDASQPLTSILRSPESGKLTENYESTKLDINRKEQRKFRNRKLNEDEVVAELQSPVKGEFISNLADSKVMLMENGRVCYACSTANDPSCWHPDRTTTIKYCKKGDDACVTRTFKAPNGLIVIRDCGHSCNKQDLPNMSSRYKSCRICHSDQCNSAHSITSLNMLLVTFIIAIFKYAL